jgi:hypothetical protein
MMVKGKMEDRTELFEGLSKSMKEGKKMWSVDELLVMIDEQVENQKKGEQ